MASSASARELASGFFSVSDADDVEPYDGRHPECAICTNRVKLPPQRSVLHPELVSSYSLEPGTDERVIHFYFHGKREQTRLLQLVLWVSGNQPLIYDADYTYPTPTFIEICEMPRAVRIHMQKGVREWVSLPKPFATVIGSASHPRRRDIYPYRSDSLCVGSFLMFGDATGKRMATMTLPIAHMVVYRHFFGKT